MEELHFLNIYKKMKMLNFPWLKTACYPIQKKRGKKIETKTIIRIMLLGQLPN